MEVVTHACWCLTQPQRVNTPTTRSRKNNQNATQQLSLEQTKSNPLFSPLCILFTRVGLSSISTSLTPYTFNNHSLHHSSPTLHTIFEPCLSHPLHFQYLRIPLSISPISLQSAPRFSSPLSLTFNCCSLQMPLQDLIEP